MYSEQLSDFSAQWCKELLESSEYINISTMNRRPLPPADAVVTNTLFSKTFKNDTGVRGWQSLQAKRINAPNLSPELLLLLSLGNGLEGYKGILHGGISAAILDQATSMCAFLTIGPSVATAEMTLRYKKSVPLPSVVLCRTAATGREDRKLWLQAVVEDGMGNVYCEADVLFLTKRTENL